MSCCSSERGSTRMHVHDHFYLMRKLRAAAGINGGRNDDVPPEVLPGLSLVAFALEHLTEIDVRQHPIPLLPRVFAQVRMGAPPNPLPQC